VLGFLIPLFTQTNFKKLVGQIRVNWSEPVSSESGRQGMKYLVEGVTHWLRYAPSKVMAFVQKVATDMLEPDPERSKSCILQLLIGLARYGTRHIRRCMARSVLPLLQSDSREVGLSLLVSCRYDLGRFGTDIVSALCHCVKDTKDPGAFSQLEMILRHSPSPGKIYPQAWVFLNCFIRRAPRSLKPKVRHLWLRLSSTWSRRDSPEDDYEYYPRGPFWLLTYPAEAQRIIRERRRNCTRCPKKYCLALRKQTLSKIDQNHNKSILASLTKQFCCHMIVGECWSQLRLHLPLLMRRDFASVKSVITTSEVGAASRCAPGCDLHVSVSTASKGQRSICSCRG